MIDKKWQVSLNWLAHIEVLPHKINKADCVMNRTEQILFYPNSGSVDGCISLYLSAEPTPEERASDPTSSTGRPTPSSSAASRSTKKDAPMATAPDQQSQSRNAEQWARAGSYRFTFEVRLLDRSLIKSMEASDYRFSSSYSNWGYQAYASRNAAYFNNPKCRADDAFVVSVSVTEPATLPNSTSASQPNKTMIPYELVQAYASLFNSKEHSDVLFVVHDPHRRKPARRLYAIKKILAMRSEYFASMFDGGWSETAHGNDDLHGVAADSDVDSEDDILSGSGSFSEFSDSDNSDNEDIQQPQNQTPAQSRRNSAFDTPLTSPHQDPPQPHPQPQTQPQAQAQPQPRIEPQRTHKRRHSHADHQRAVVHITDASYSTFRGCLYWLYTDFIHFAELSSTYRVSGDQMNRVKWTMERARAQRESSGWKSEGAAAAALVPLVGDGAQHEERLWLSNAKEVYRLADSQSISLSV